MSHPNPDWGLVEQAAYSAVHDYRARNGQCGAHALAPLLHKNPRALSNEVNPEADGHKFGLNDAVTVSVIANDARILLAFAAELHHAVIPLPDYTRVSDVELLNAYANWQAFVGRTCGRFRDVIEDHRITHSEVESVKLHGFEHIAKFFVLIRRLEALVDDE